MCGRAYGQNIDTQASFQARTQLKDDELGCSVMMILFKEMLNQLEVALNQQLSDNFFVMFFTHKSENNTSSAQKKAVEFCFCEY
ncbi:hypothetical protein LXL04_005115 [Taraxacum kok-saghyz]